MMGAVPETVQQWHDELDGAPHGGMKLAGQKFGELTAIRAVGRRATYGMLWLCRCDCGRMAIRLAGKLTWAVKNGHTPACSECNSGARSGHFIERRSVSAEQLAAAFYEYGSLYAPQYDEHEAAAIREELGAAELAPGSEETALDIASVIYDRYTPGRPQHGAQRWAFLIPLAGKLWACTECRTDIIEGFGCIACAKMVCRSCAAAESHLCVTALHTYYLRALEDKYQFNKLVQAGKPLPKKRVASSFTEEQMRHKREATKRLHDKRRQDWQQPRLSTAETLEEVQARLQRETEAQRLSNRRRMRKHHPVLHKLVFGRDAEEEETK